ncbi:hypothetical protein BGZ94_005890 [Podila epigama]|nr:hypothetical protein BGZ94_005890 [Podila epigama]
MSFADEFRSGNFSLYGQWQVWTVVHRLIIAFLLVFIEIPLCLKCCPTSATLTIGYTVFAIIMWIAVKYTLFQFFSASLLTLAAISYGIATVRHQTPASSSITGGAGVSTIV